jgi:hypothetical protein
LRSSPASDHGRHGKWLDEELQLKPPSREEMADRFFYGDVATMKALEEGYQLRKNV